MAKFSVSYIDTSTGENIAYREAGQGERTFVLVHGNTSSSVFFEDLMEELAKDNKVYALDLAGFGDSTYNRILYSLFDMSKDLSEFIIKLDLKNVYLLGWSTGGGVCLETAVDLPDRIKQVYLLSSVGLKGYHIYKKTIFTPLSTELVRTREEMLDYNLLASPMISMFKSKNRNMMRGVLDHSIYTKKKPPADKYNEYIDAALKQRNYLDVLTALVNFNITNDVIDGVKGSGRIDFLKCPVKIIHGDYDIVCDLSNARETFDYLGLQSELKIFRGCGHSIMTDNFEGLVKYIKSKYIFY